MSPTVTEARERLRHTLASIDPDRLGGPSTETAAECGCERCLAWLLLDALDREDERLLVRAETSAMYRMWAALDRLNGAGKSDLWGTAEPERQELRA